MSDHQNYLVVGKNDVASVAQFAYKCILEHFFFTCWNIGWDKSQVGHTGQ